MRKLLLVFAHPDDESFVSGVTVAKYVRAGWIVDLICATRGEKGSSGSHGDVTPAALGDIREAELTKASSILGISSITFLDYIDGSLAKLVSGDIDDKIYRQMLERKPDCVITFDRTGISNHPDHIRVCRSATFAFQKYAKYVETLRKPPPKLYYACLPASVCSYLQKNNILSKELHGKPLTGVDDDRLTTVIEGRSYASKKKKALLAHVSQQENVERFLRLPSNPLQIQEYFILHMEGTKEYFMGKNDKIVRSL